MAQGHRAGSSAAACILKLPAGGAVVGSIDGWLTLNERTDDESCWLQKASAHIHEAAAVDSIHMLLPILLLVNCAGQLSVRVLPDLRSVDGGTIATRCTGALCLQERSLVSASVWPRGHARDSAVRICAAMHGICCY